MQVKDILKNKTPSSSATYKIMGRRSDGQLREGKGPKPVTPADHKIHIGHIIDSSQYNLRHEYDHGDELAFDYQRLSKEKLDKEAKALQNQTMRILNPIYRKMGLKLVTK